jgi:hypothetical protein
MELALGHGLSFCRVGGRTIFLDIAADRYLCLSPAAEASFLRLTVNGGHSGSYDAHLASMMARGLLVAAGASAPLQPCPAPPLARTSMLDAPLRPCEPRQVAGALYELGVTRWRLRRAGLTGTVAHLKRQKRACAAGDKRRFQRRTAEPETILAGFVCAARVTSLLDTCLTQSVAVASRMISGGLQADVVLGVQLGPFAAHCWVQHKDTLVNDRFDVVRTFVPILVI